MFSSTNGQLLPLRRALLSAATHRVSGQCAKSLSRLRTLAVVHRPHKRRMRILRYGSALAEAKFDDQGPRLLEAAFQGRSWHS